MKKKTSIPLDQVIKKVVTPFSRSGSKRAEPPNSQPMPPKSSSRLPMKSFFISIYCTLLQSPEQAENHHQCCWSGDGSASIQQRQKTQRRINLLPI